MNNLVPSQSNRIADSATALRRPQYEAERRDSGYQVQVYLPGVARDAIQLTFENEVLSVRGRRLATVGEQQKVLHRETFLGEYRLDLNVDAKIDVEGIKATYENGVLSVELPFAPEVQPRQIAIQ
ncbi:MAG: Hsp20/alpha crystallin family protein [Verrucomicrobiota bacterium JB022]|nr:Hsp20/alpha crystallin family protein [Verrucomicrobiota bacterium JB022]